MSKYIVLIALVGLVGCGAPALSSSMRTNFEGNESVTTDCVQRRLTFKDRERIINHIEIAAKENWRLSYFSEYKGSMRRKYEIMYCFEHVAY